MLPAPHHRYAYLCRACTIYRPLLVSREHRRERPVGADRVNRDYGQAREAEEFPPAAVRSRPALCISKIPVIPSTIRLSAARPTSPVRGFARAPHDCRTVVKEVIVGFIHVAGFSNGRRQHVAWQQPMCDVMFRVLAAGGEHCAAFVHASRIRALASERLSPGR